MSSEASIEVPPRPRLLPALPSLPGKYWYHAISTTCAAFLALYVSFALELESPGSSAVTVLIVSSPLPGMVLSKGIWRFVGTFVGLVISIVLIARFAQSPPAFVLSLAIWLGLCTYVSSLLRYFRAYAAVLAGYTISLVALPAIDNPDQIFDLATNRIAVVTVGIVCTAIVKSLFALKVGPRRLMPALQNAFAVTAGFAAQALNLDQDLPQRRRVVGEHLIQLDPLIHAAANESAETAQQAPAVRLFVSILVGIMTLASSVRDELAALPENGPVAAAITPLRDTVRDLLRSLSGMASCLAPETRLQLAEARRSASGLALALTTTATPETLDALALATRLEDILGQLDLARGHLTAIQQGHTGRKVAPVTYHRDTRAAMINGLRAGVATLASGAFWIASAWSSGPLMLAAVLPICALLGTADRPDLASAGFARGIVLAGACAFVCDFFMLAQVDGFPLMALAIAPFLIVACLTSFFPKHAGSSTAFLIFFTTFLNLRNPMQYDVTAFLNQVFAIALGSIFGVIAFKTLWPTHPVRIVRRLIRRLSHDLVEIADQRAVPALAAWESGMHDRLAQLSTRLVQSPDRAAVIEGGIAAIHIGRELVRVRLALNSLSLTTDLTSSVDAVWRALRRVETEPHATVEAARAAAIRLLEAAKTDTGRGDRASLMRVAAAFHETAQLLFRHEAFFVGSLPIGMSEA